MENQCKTDLSHRLARDASEFSVESQMFPGSKFVEERVKLRTIAETSLRIRQVCLYTLGSDESIAASRCQIARQHFERCSLARAIYTLKNEN